MSPANGVIEGAEMKYAMRVAFVVILVSIALPFSALAQSLGAVLTGAEEAPGPGDPEGFGSATVTFNAERTQITITTRVGGLSSVTAGHIHIGPDGAPGPVVVGFVSASMPFVNGQPVTLPIDPALANDILENPHGYYINLHNAQFPDGAIRGQLSGDDTTMFGGWMTGDREAPGPGDEDGRGAFIITLDDERDHLTFDVVVEESGTDFTGAHIHPGVEGEPGPVLVGLMSEAHPFVDGRLSGTIAIPEEVGEAIAANPTGYYVNVHTTA